MFRFDRAMRRILTSAIFAVFLLAPGVKSAEEAPAITDETPASAGEMSASAVIEALHDSLIAAMKEGGTSPFDTRSDRLEPVIAQSFDMALIARVSMGRRYWKKLDKARNNPRYRARVQKRLAAKMKQLAEKNPERAERFGWATAMPRSCCSKTRFSRRIVYWVRRTPASTRS